MTYAVRYLAGAYRAAGGNESRAVALYARGYNAPRFQEASFDRPAESVYPPEEASSMSAQRLYAYMPSGDGQPAYRFHHYRHHPV